MSAASIGASRLQHRPVDDAEDCARAHAELRGEPPVLARHRCERGKEDARGERGVEEDVRDQDARKPVEPAAGVEAEEPQPLPDPAGAAEHCDDAEHHDDRRQHAREVERRDEEAPPGKFLAAGQRQRQRRAEHERDRGRERRLQEREADDAADIAPGEICGLRLGREEEAEERGDDHDEDERERENAGQVIAESGARNPHPLVSRGFE